MNLIGLIGQYLNGIKILSQWDGVVVSGERAQLRTNTCLRCPMNQPGNVLVEYVSNAIKRRMEEKVKSPLHTEGIEKLRTCQSCNCPLPGKIWMPLQSIYPREEDKKDYWERCWILNES